jgi:hypothetical protein
VLSAVFVLLQFFPRNVFFKLASFQESCYHFFIRPEDRALLESNPSAAAGDDGGAGLLCSASFFPAPPDSL